MPKTTNKDMEKVIHHATKVIHHINKLRFDASKGREIMDEYLRIMEGKWYMEKVK